MNNNLFQYIYAIGQNYSNLAPAIIFFANTLGYLLLVLLAYFLFSREDKERGAKELAVMISAAGLAWIIAHIIKALYPVDRPFVAMEGLIPLFPHEADGSFPSGHATFYSGLAMAMYFYNRRLALFLAIGAVLIGLSRIATGVHFPIDILVGFILGPATVFIVYKIVNFGESV